MAVTRIIRTILGLMIGLLLISVLVEGVEFGLVTAVNRGPAADPDTYYGIRNQGWFLALKLVYNTAAAVVGGLAAALIAGYAPARHGLALAIIQTLAFAWALTQPDFGRWTPLWMWLVLIVFTFAGILFGARLRLGRSV